MHDIYDPRVWSHSRLLEHLGLARKQWWWLVVVADSERAQLFVEPFVRVDFASGILRLTWQAPRLRVRFSHPASSARIPLLSGALAFSATQNKRVGLSRTNCTSARELIKWVEINARYVGGRGGYFRMHRDDDGDDDDDDDPFLIVSFGGEQIGSGQFSSLRFASKCPMPSKLYDTLCCLSAH